MDTLGHHRRPAPGQVLVYFAQMHHNFGHGPGLDLGFYSYLVVHRLRNKSLAPMA